MKRYLVEVRLGYDVRADTADEALRLVSPAIQDDETIAVEYSVRERREATPRIESKSPDLHGLTKLHLGAGPGDERRVILVVIGADLQGKKHLVALDEAMSESELSWRELLTDLRARGLRMPELAVADGANGFWSALAAIYPQTKQQRCWVHKIRNILDKVPEKLKAEVHRELREICQATSRAEATSKIESLSRSLSKNYPKAAACVRDDVDRMLRFFDFPKASWKSLRTTNPIESNFASVKRRTKVASRLRSGESALYLVFKLLERQSMTWRRINGYQTIALAERSAA